MRFLPSRPGRPVLQGQQVQRPVLLTHHCCVRLGIAAPGQVDPSPGTLSRRQPRKQEPEHIHQLSSLFCGRVKSQGGLHLASQPDQAHLPFQTGFPLLAPHVFRTPDPPGTGAGPHDLLFLVQNPVHRGHVLKNLHQLADPSGTKQGTPKVSHSPLQGHHHDLGGHHCRLEGAPDQPDRHPGPRQLHRQSGTLPSRAGAKGSKIGMKPSLQVDGRG